jgi:hypothetical protein
LGVHGQLEVLRLLLERGAAVDAVKPATGGTAFHSACDSNQPECVEALVRAGCDVGIKDQRGATGLEIAARRGHAAVVKRLRAVVAEQLRATGPAPEPELARGGGNRLALELVGAALEAAALEGAVQVAAARVAPAPEPAAAAGPAGAGALALGLHGAGALAWQLCEAAEEGDAAAVARLLAAGVHPNGSVAMESPSGEVLEEVSVITRTSHCT